MRTTTLLRKILGFQHTFVRGFEFTSIELVIDVAPTTRVPRCGGCYRPVRRLYDCEDARLWRHLDLGGLKTLLRYGPRRVECDRCGVRTELVPWAQPGSQGFTQPFEDLTALLAQRCDQTTVSRLMDIAWMTVGRIVARVAERRGPSDRLAGLRLIGIDELSYRRHHQYITIVVNHETGDVVWARPGKNADTLRQFFEDLGPERTAELKTVTIDMSAAYEAAVRDKAPHVEIIFDRFHVQRLAHDAVDEVRRAQVRERKNTPEGKGLKKMRWALLKNRWNLFPEEVSKLADLQTLNRHLYRAYLLKESLVHILNRRQSNVARIKLREWIAWAQRSRLQPFVKLARTINKHLEGIVAYIRTGLSNGRTEGLNGKIRTITRRAYGFHSADSLIGLIFLCCSGIIIQPPRIYPSPAYPQTC